MPDHLMEPALAPTPGYAHVVRLAAGEQLVVTAGAVPLDADGTLVGAGDIIAQTRQVVSNLQAQLRAAGSDLSCVVKTTVYVASTDRADLRTAWDVVRESALSTGPHASTLLGVTALGYTGQLVEIEAIAVRSPEALAEAPEGP